MDTIIMLTVSLTFLILSLLLILIKDRNNEFTERRTNAIIKKEINSIQDYIDEVNNSKIGILNECDIIDTNIVDILKK